MEMIIWLLPIILTNQAYQLRTSRLSQCLWVFLFYYLKLIKQLIVGPYVPFHTADTWSEKQQLDIYFMTMQQSSLTGLKAVCPSLYHLVSNIEKTWDTFIYRCTYWEANKLVSMSTCILFIHLAFVWKPFLCVLSRYSSGISILFVHLMIISKHVAEIQWSPCRISDKIQT